MTMQRFGIQPPLAVRALKVFFTPWLMQNVFFSFELLLDDLYLRDGL